MSYDLFAEYYDELMSEVDYSARAKYIDSLIKSYKPDAHLLVDLACGTGSMTVELAAMGYDVIGVDLSENMLSKAREKSDVSILYLCQSMQQLDMYGTIDAFVCTLDSPTAFEKFLSPAISFLLSVSRFVDTVAATAPLLNCAIPSSDV